MLLVDPNAELFAFENGHLKMGIIKARSYGNAKSEKAIFINIFILYTRGRLIRIFMKKIKSFV
jgi:hypothetical protein